MRSIGIRSWNAAMISLVVGLFGCGGSISTEERDRANGRKSVVSNSSRFVDAAATTAAPSSWSATGAMPPGNFFELAEGPSTVLLRDGRVLVAAYENVLYDPVAGIWTKTASMSVRRGNGARLALLNDGRVLAAGGGSEIAELYDPSTDTWTQTGSMVADRIEHTATLLKDGRVLVAGGMFCNGSFCLSPPPARAAPEELYDPATGKWTQTGSSFRPNGHTATLLNDGRVLVVGGVGTEAYDPATGAWSRAGTMPFNTGSYSHTATLLSDGRVLVVIGSSAALYDPPTGTWALTGSPGEFHIGHTATRLASGKVLVAGGASECTSMESSSAQLNKSEEYDPVNGTWSSGTTMGMGRFNHAAALLNDGRVLVAGGIDTMIITAEGSCWGPTFTQTAEIYAPGQAPAPVPSNFTVAANPASLSSAPGSPASSVISITPWDGFTGTVALSVAGNPAGSAAALTPTDVAVGPVSGSSALTISPGSVAPGTYWVTVTATSGSLVHTAGMIYTIAPKPDFSVAAVPGSVSSAEGRSADSVVTVAPLSGFNGTVSLSVAGNPAGSTAVMSPATIAVGAGPASAASTLTLSPGSAPPGTYIATVTATSGALSHATTLSYTIVPRAAATAIVFRSAATAGYPSVSTRVISVPIPAGALPGDLLIASIGFGNTGATALPTIVAPPGWTLIRRADHGIVNSLAVYCHVHAASDVVPAWTLNQSVGGSASISAYTGAGASPVDVSAGKDAGSGSSFTTPTIVTGGPNELIVAGFFAHSAAGATSWTVQSPLAQRSNFNNGGSRSMTTADAVQAVAGASAAYTATASVLQGYALSYALALRPGQASAPAPADFAIAANPASVSSSGGSSASSVLTVTPSGGFSGTVALSAAGNPAGSTAVLSPSSLAVATASGSSTLTLSPGSAAAGTYIVTVTATSGSLSRAVTVSYSILPSPPAGGIVFRSAATSSYPSVSTRLMSVSIPAGTVAGDLLIASVGFGNTGATVLPGITAPPGWTLVRRVDHGIVNSLAVYWHVHAAGEVAPVWSVNQSVGGAASISTYTGVASIPIDISAAKDAGSASRFTSAAVVTRGSNELLVMGFFAHSAGGPTDWIVQSPLNRRSNFNNAGSRSMTTADALQAAAGTSAEYAASASVLQGYVLSYVVALQPATAAVTSL
jgi:hypothetical protein